MGSLSTLHQLTPLYTAVLVVVAAMWLWQIAQAARKSLWPRLGILMPLGLVSLLAAPVLDVPALFGMGAAFVLIAAYFPLMQLRATPRRYALVWTLLTVAVALAWMVAAVQLQSVNYLFGSVALLLYSWALLLSALLYPRRAAHSAPLNGPTTPFLRRWQGAVIPTVADLELTLEVDAARLLNTSGQTLYLAGWSPASANAWLGIRNEAGQPLAALNAGETAYLTPWSPISSHPNEGVRLWYSREGEDATYLFRADWANSWAKTSLEVGERVLN